MVEIIECDCCEERHNEEEVFFVEFPWEKGVPTVTYHLCSKECVISFFQRMMWDTKKREAP